MIAATLVAGLALGLPTMNARYDMSMWTGVEMGRSTSDAPAAEGPRRPPGRSTRRARASARRPAPPVRPPVDEVMSASPPPPDAPPPAEAPAAGHEPQRPPPTRAPSTIERDLVGATTPTIEELQEAALRRATVDPRTTRRWLARARAAAALPTVRGEIDVRRDQAWQLDQAAGTADELSQDAGAGQIYRVRVAWELDRLIFDPNELRAARAMVDMALAREQILVRVTQLYFERLQLLAELQESPGEGDLARRLRIRELEALLHGLTGLHVRGPEP